MIFDDRLPKELDAAAGCLNGCLIAALGMAACGVASAFIWLIFVH